MASFAAFAIFKADVAIAQYCTTSLYNNGCIYGDYIDDITIGSIIQTNTGCSGLSEGYADYTSLTAIFEQGNSYSFNVTCGFDDEYINIWIDFDNDSVFESNEIVLTNFYCANANSNYATTFSIPSLAAVGNHRMRVRDVYNTVNAQPCAVYSYGEVHDYTANILAAATNMSYTKSEATQNDTSNILKGTTTANILGIEIITDGSLNPFAATSFTINSTGTSNFANDVTAVKIYSTGSSNIFNTNQLFGSAANLSSPIVGSILLLPDTNFFWVVYDLSPAAALDEIFDAQCTKIVMSGAGGTKVPAITSPSGNRTIDYCEPTYSNDCSEDFINGVTLNTLSNLQSGCNGFINNYIKYNPSGNLTTTLTLGNNYPITLSSSGEYNEAFGVWIDFNQDGDFADGNEFVYSTPYAGTDTFIGNILLPLAYNFAGERRMRIRCAYNTILNADDYCSDLSYGETEDYTITLVLPVCSGTPFGGIVIAEPTSFCEPGTIIFLHDTQLQIVAGLQLQWQQSADGFLWTNIIGATDTIYTSLPLFDTTFYRVKVTCSSSGSFAYSNTVKIIMFPTPIVSFTGLDSTYNVDATAITLTGNPAGGIFSGAGINGNIFDPAIAGVGGPYEIIYTYTDSNGCTASDTQLVTVLFFNGILIEEIFSSFSVYPNPNDGKFFIELNSSSPKNNFTLSIYNLLGNEVYVKKYSSLPTQKNIWVDLSNLKKGNYLLQISSENSILRETLNIE
ncbi:MAG: GEVED domain-containing protein [Chitinophagales bacterium]|nr:GEVED domain-containing protein [Chitinophagales bacterium]